MTRYKLLIIVFRLENISHILCAIMHMCYQHIYQNVLITELSLSDGEVSTICTILLAHSNKIK